MQQALVALGYLKGASDGNFGTGTKTAVENFQKDNGLDVDGLRARRRSKSSTPFPGDDPDSGRYRRAGRHSGSAGLSKTPSFKERLCSDADRTLYRIYSIAWFKELLRKRL